MRAAVVLGILWIGPLLASCQIPVSTGGVVSLDEYCKNEIVKANLLVKADDTVLMLTLRDESGAPFSNTGVTLYKVNSESLSVQVKTDVRGVLSVPHIDHGNYRMLINPARAWRQPDLRCENRECNIDRVIQVMPTDQPFVACPPK